MPAHSQQPSPSRAVLLLQTQPPNPTIYLRFMLPCIPIASLKPHLQPDVNRISGSTLPIKTQIMHPIIEHTAACARAQALSCPPLTTPNHSDQPHAAHTTDKTAPHSVEN